MSEERAQYNNETPQEDIVVIREEAPRKFYSQMPNLVDDLGLTPHAYRLYGHLRRVVGDAGKCWQNTATLSKICNMSAAKISEAKKELENTQPPLIRIVSEKHPNGGIYHEVYVTDIWQFNVDFYEKKVVHIVKGLGRSHYENTRSQYERKNNPIKEEPSYGSIEPKTIEQAIYANRPVTPDMLNNDAEKRDIANLIGMGMGILSGDASELAFAFMKERNIIIPNGKIKGQRKVLREMIEMKVKPYHVVQAVKDLMDKGMTVVDLYSVAKTATDLANKPEKKEEKTRLL